MIVRILGEIATGKADPSTAYLSKFAIHTPFKHVYAKIAHQPLF